MINAKKSGTMSVLPTFHYCITWHTVVDANKNLFNLICRSNIANDTN